MHTHTYTGLHICTFVWDTHTHTHTHLDINTGTHSPKHTHAHTWTQTHGWSKTHFICWGQRLPDTERKPLNIPYWGANRHPKLPIPSLTRSEKKAKKEIKENKETDRVGAILSVRQVICKFVQAVNSGHLVNTPQLLNWFKMLRSRALNYCLGKQIDWIQYIWYVNRLPLLHYWYTRSAKHSWPFP